MSVTVEDLGPMVARIAESTPGYADLNLLAQTHTKQRVLDLILPGVETLLAEVNQQIDGIERSGAIKALDWVSDHPDVYNANRTEIVWAFWNNPDCPFKTEESV